jgi:hypothetical protein
MRRNQPLETKATLASVGDQVSSNGEGGRGSKVSNEPRRDRPPATQIPARNSPNFIFYPDLTCAPSTDHRPSNRHQLAAIIEDYARRQESEEERKAANRAMNALWQSHGGRPRDLQRPALFAEAMQLIESGCVSSLARAGIRLARVRRMSGPEEHALVKWLQDEARRRKKTAGKPFLPSDDG